MSHNNGKIAAPVSIYDVQQVIGNSSPDLGTLCVANSINKWARYKPERADGPMPLSHGTTDQVRTRNANHFGLTIPYCVDAIMSDLAHEVLIREASAWDYLKPRGDRSGSGGVKVFYRLTIDFHHASSSADYTSRLITTDYGTLNLQSKTSGGTDKLSGFVVGANYDGSFIQIGNIKIVYDSSNNALKIIKSDGTAANLYATGGVAALGTT